MAKEVIEIIARGALLRDGRVLLCRNVKHRYYYLPGGHVEFGEHASRAVVREFSEETGLEVSASRCVLVSEGIFRQGRRDRHELNLVFHVEHPAMSSIAVKSLEPKIAFEWVELAAVTDLDVRPEAIKAWLAAGAPVAQDGAEWVPATG